MDVQEGRLAALKHAVERSLAADQRAIYNATALACGQSPQLSAAASVVAEAEAFYRFLCGGSPKSEATHTPQTPKPERETQCFTATAGNRTSSQAAFASRAEGGGLADLTPVAATWERTSLLGVGRQTHDSTANGAVSSVSWVRHSRTRAGSRFRWPKRGILRKGEKQSENEENQTAVSVIAGISVVPAENRHPAR